MMKAGWRHEGNSSARIADKTSPAHGETLLVVEGHRKPFRVMRFGLPRKDAFLQSCGVCFTE